MSLCGCVADFFSRKERRGRKGLGCLFLAVGCAEDERSESEGRFGEAEPVGCASIRERVDRVEGISWSFELECENGFLSFPLSNSNFKLQLLPTND